MALVLPKVTTEPTGERPALELTHAEMVGVQKWLNMAVNDVALQGKAKVDAYAKSKIITTASARQKREFKAELRGFDVLLSWLRAMQATVDAMLDTHSGEKGTLN